MKTTVTADGMQIKVITAWSASAVRVMCIKHEWYTRGDNEAYAKMLGFVDDNEPTTENIYRVAKDIFEHSVFEGGDIDSIMFTVQDETVKRFYVLDGGD